MIDLWLVWVVLHMPGCQVYISRRLTAKYTSFPSCSLSISLTSTVGWPFVPVLVEGWITSLFSRPAEGCEALEKGACLGQRHRRRVRV